MRLLSGLIVLALSSPGFAAGPAPRIELRSGTLAGPGDTAGLPQRLLAGDADLADGGLVLLKLSGPSDPAVRATAEAAGVRLVAPIGSDGFLAAIPPGGGPSARALPGLSWLAPYHPGLRIAPEILTLDDVDDDRVVPVTVHLLHGTDLDVVASRARSLGLTVRGRSTGSAPSGRLGERPARIVLTPTAHKLAAVREAIARWPETLWIGRRPVYGLLNDQSAWVGQTGLDGDMATPVYDHGIFGDGQVVAVLDTGLDADMCYFRDGTLGLPPTVVGFGVGSPDTDQRKVLIVDFLWTSENPANPSDWDTQDHGTHVAGSVLGDNLANPGVRDAGDGMAPAAKLVMQDGGYGVDDCADMPAIGCPAADLTPFFNQAYLQGARIHSNSWGDRENFTPFNIYSDGSEDADAFMWSHPDFLLVFAAGNNGPGLDTIASPATAKNVLSVGATAHGEGAGSLASFSSRGDTHDDRIKPDVTIPGSGVISANNDLDVTTHNCGTRSMSGTSMACPTAAGLAALVREYYEKGYYPSGAANPPDGFVPSAALLKATLIASAAPMENLGTPPPEPNQGWGRIKLDDALFFPGDSKRLFAADPADQFGSPADPAEVYTVEILDGTEPLRAVVAWTDYPSTPAASVNLVNDLDLEVESPGGTLYRGNVFSAGASVPGGSADRINNVEAVRIEDPEPGVWTVRVRPFAVPQPSQGFGLVVTGRIPVQGVFLERTSIALDDSVGGDADGVLEPGEWVDLPLSLFNSGDSTAVNVQAQVESLSPDVQVIVNATSLPDIAKGADASSGPSHLRVRMTTTLRCTDPISLRFTYLADGHQVQEETTFPTGSEAVFLTDDLEGTTGWGFVASESTATTGDWTLGDPDGTDYQPEDDATVDPGTVCLYTAPNSGGTGTDDVDDGVVVARSGAYDLSGHPEARLRISRWFANRDLGEDSGDFFRLEIRENPSSADQLLEELDTDSSDARWTEVTFRIADSVTPGPDVELKVSAADGTATGNIIEAAIDELVFWDPACDTHDPPPNPVLTLTVGRNGDDVRLDWERPGIDPSHGETSRYRVYRSDLPSGGFALQQELTDPGATASWTDPAAISSGGSFYYEVIAGNAAGDAGTLP